MKKSWLWFAAAFAVFCLGAYFYRAGFSQRIIGFESGLPDVLMGAALFGGAIALAMYGWLWRIEENLPTG